MPTEELPQDTANLLSGIDRERPDFANSLSSAAERIRELAQLVAARLDGKRSEQRDLGSSRVAHDDELLGHSREVDRLEGNLARLTREWEQKKQEVNAFAQGLKGAGGILQQQSALVDEANAGLAILLPPEAENFISSPPDNSLRTLSTSLKAEMDQQGTVSEWEERLGKARDELNNLKKELLAISKVLLENRGKRDAAKLLVDEEERELEDLHKTISDLESIGRDLEEAVVFTELLQENMRLLGTLEGEISVDGKTTSQVRDDLRRRLDAVIAHVTGRLVERTLAVRGVEQELIVQSDRLNLCVLNMRGAFEDGSIGTEAHRIGLHASVENLVRLVRGFDARYTELAAQTSEIKGEANVLLERFSPDRVIVEAAAPVVLAEAIVGESSEAVAAELDNLRAELKRQNIALIEVGIRETELLAQIDERDAALEDLSTVRARATNAEAKAAALQAELDHQNEEAQAVDRLKEELIAARGDAERERVTKLQLVEDLGRARADLRGKEDEAAGLRTELGELLAKGSATAAPTAQPVAVPLEPAATPPAQPEASPAAVAPSPAALAVPPPPAPALAAAPAEAPPPLEPPAATTVLRATPAPRPATPPVPFVATPPPPAQQAQAEEVTAVIRPPAAPPRVVGGPRPPGRPGRR